MCDIQVFFDGSPFGVLRADAAGRASYVNPAYGELTGRGPEQLLGYGWVDTIHPGDQESALKQWCTACDSGLPLDIHFRLARLDGTRRFVRLRGRLLGQTGGAGGYLATVVDLTEQILAERRLRRNNELLSAVLENIPCGITAYDAAGRLLLDNQRVRGTLDLPDDPQDQAITDFGTVSVVSETSNPVDRQAASLSPASTDATAGVRVREEIQSDGRVLEVRDAQMPTGGIVTTYTDVTGQKQYIDTLRQAKADAEQAAAAKAAFLATMSHEIRTPMNGVIGMTNILLETRLSPDQRELVEVIRQSGESLLVVINDILDYSKIESGQMELEWLPLRLHEVVDNCLRLLSSKAEEKGVNLSAEVDPSIPALILGDRTRLQQVLVNLLSNAVKFTDDGQVRITLTNCGREPAVSPGATGDLCEIEVCIRDTGIGIPREKLEVIFAPFVQADSSTARRFGGTGLGLAIAKRLVQAMGGSISLKSEAGAGTEVCFTFMAEAAVPHSRATANNQLPLWQKRVLLVAGRRADVSILQTQLRRWGMEVEVSARPSDARAMLAKGAKFDILLAALHMSSTRWFDYVHSLRDQGVGVPAILIARSGANKEAEKELGACIVSRASTEPSLYDALADALRAGGDPVFFEASVSQQFDDSLAHSVPLSILVAEDNEINRKVALRMLAGFGYTAETAQNGAEVIEAVQQRRYDLVLMDIQMPHVDGIDATRFIVEHFPPSRRPRVIAMSANVGREDVEAALAAGADHYIAKPFAPSELRAVLQESAQRGAVGKSAFPDSEPHVLSLERVQCNLEGDPTGRFLKELCRDFAECSAALGARLQAAVAAGKVVEVRSIVHEYAGVCAVVGAQKLARILIDMQKIARAGSLKGVVVQIQKCVHAREETIAALEAAVRQYAARRLPRSTSLDSGHGNSVM